MKWKHSRKIAAFVGTVVAVVGLLLFAAVSPETRAGYWLFRCVYAGSVSKHSLLDTYRSNLWTFEGGSTPDLTDQFLCSRIEASSSRAEIDAVARFYALQASGREGKRIISLSDEAKKKVIGSIMHNLDSYEEWDVGRALLLVEEMRRGEMIWKGSFGPRNPQESANWSGWWSRRGLNKVKALYRKWWQAPSPWAVKKTQNPLAGSGIEATGL